MPTISAIIITKNEAKNIEACIESVLWVDEIIVLDSGSTDKTKDICKKYVPKVKLYETDWPGFGVQKNRALGFASSEWVLSVDADEILTSKLKQEILNTLKSACYVAYKIPRVSYFFGKPLRYGFSYVADRQVRLAKKGLCKFSDDIIHEKIIVTGEVGVLKNKLNHFSIGSIEELLNKVNNYSTLGALKLYNKNKKTSFNKAFIHAIWAFIRIYFFNGLFFNGWRGFIVAFSKFEGVFFRYVKLLELNSVNKACDEKRVL